MGTLYVVGTPIGNLDDMSKRQIETLKDADIILCEDTRHSMILLNNFNIKNKLSSYHKFNETEKTSKVLDILKNGKTVALITDAGMPCVSDPGYILVKACHENNINVVGVGGISASLTALSISGIDSKTFSFLGFFPREKKEKEILINNIENSFINTFIFYESPKRIIDTLTFLYNALGNINICVCKELTKIHEKTIANNIKTVIEILENDEDKEKGEYTVIIETESKSIKEEKKSIEAQLIDIIIKNNVTIKEAINILNESDNTLSKKDIYNASLNLKDILNKNK